MTSHPPIQLLPTRIARLNELAFNLWWTWNADAQNLCHQLDPDLWESVDHNPVTFLKRVDALKLEAASHNRIYLREYARVIAAFDAYMNVRHSPDERNGRIAFISAEWGIHESMPLASGGLGILAGDYLKAASDRGVPFAGFGLFYRQGFFQQHVDTNGAQEARYERIDPVDRPMRPAIGRDGKPATVTVELDGRQVDARIWHIQLGRVPIYLLDTDVESNSQPDRELTARLYQGDRLGMEVVLGVGAVRALRALGYEPTTWHINEGHAALAGLELLREMTQEGQISFHDALESVRRRVVFTTHTPVPAGHDVFPLQLVESYLRAYFADFHISGDEFLALGRQDSAGGPMFNMTLLALHLSHRANAVSRIHQRVAQKMLGPLLPESQIEISAVTNAVHTPTWLAPELAELFDRYLPAGWRTHLDDPAVWNDVSAIPADVLWETHVALKRRAIDYVRARTRRLREAQGASAEWVAAADRLFEPDVLTIAFARRFAGYKRATLIFHDIERLIRILNHPARPVQVIFAGKAHPADEAGRSLLQEVYHLCQEPRVQGKLIFLADYDPHMARVLVQGVEVWLNNPRPPLEASGTSGMKAGLNGVLNLSVLDGWWAEGYRPAGPRSPGNGWAIASPEHARPEVQDEADSQALYELLETQVVPAFYHRGHDGLPHDWIAMMKAAIRTIAPVFCCDRMLKEYLEVVYPQREA